ncbi:MAG: signal peptide peptidase SppA [Dehalococcoidia bacterium]|nr:signal peptide peptidase SppA [Dehalococcoidia bacterium]
MLSLIAPSALRQLRPQTIAVVDVQGAIGPSVRPLEYARLFTKLRDDDSVRAVVLNIDSPGGSATGSDLMARAVLRLREEKPVVAFIGGLGASGGYMLASAAHYVIALPAALVGAIGVIAYRPLVFEALDKIGVQMRVSKSGRLKDMLSPFREATEEEQAKEQRLIDAMYDLFVEGVAHGRNLPEERVRELATGEVFATPDALAAGLIDRTGDIEDAIDWAAERSGAPRRTRIVRPKRGLRDLVLGRASMALAESIGAELEASLYRGGAALYRGPRLG